MPSPHHNPPVLEALIQATELSHSAEEFALRLDTLRGRYDARGQEKDFQYCLLHWLRTAVLPSKAYREEIARRLA